MPGTAPAAERTAGAMHPSYRSYSRSEQGK
jgi:hypothetical protein